MAVSKVNYGGRTLIDLTNDSVTPETMVAGATAHDAAGNRIVGTGNYVPVTRKINGKALSQDITLSAGDVAADASGTAASAVSSHNSSTSAHSDIRQAVSNAANAASTAQTTANAAKAAIPTKTSQLTNDSGFKTTDTNTTYTFATGDSNGQIKVTPSGGSAQNVSVKGLGSAAYTASTAYATAAQGTLASNALPKAGGNISGHIYLTGANAGSSTGSTSQLVFGTSSSNHVVLSSNTKALVINPSTSATTNQIVLYLDQPSQFPSGISTSAAIYEMGTALSSKYAPKYTYSTTDLTAGSSSLADGILYFVYE